MQLQYLDRQAVKAVVYPARDTQQETCFHHYRRVESCAEPVGCEREPAPWA
jgi:hypothetical protein